jgi:hypothetical protein
MHQPSCTVGILGTGEFAVHRLRKKIIVQLDTQNIHLQRRRYQPQTGQAEHMYGSALVPPQPAHQLPPSQLRLIRHRPCCPPSYPQPAAMQIMSSPSGFLARHGRSRIVVVVHHPQSYLFVIVLLRLQNSMLVGKIKNKKRTYPFSMNASQRLSSLFRPYCQAASWVGIASPVATSLPLAANSLVEVIVVGSFGSLLRFFAHHHRHLGCRHHFWFGVCPCRHPALPVE